MEKPLAGSNPMLHFQIRTPSTGVRLPTTLFHGLIELIYLCVIFGTQLLCLDRLDGNAGYSEHQGNEALPGIKHDASPLRGLGQGNANTKTPLPPRGLCSSGMRSPGRIVAQLEAPIEGPATNATNCLPSTA